jgi:hypothetical protein
MESKDVKSAARGRWRSILNALAPQLQPALDRVGHHVACPVHVGVKMAIVCLVMWMNPGEVFAIPAVSIQMAWRRSCG